VGGNDIRFEASYYSDYAEYVWYNTFLGEGDRGYLKPFLLEHFDRAFHWMGRQEAFDVLDS
jgi:hypothetical protein